MLPYDKKDPKSIADYAKRLCDKTLRELVGSEVNQLYSGKGGFGRFVEEVYFLYKANSDSNPDFKEAGIELKTTPLQRSIKGLVSKERLVLNIINYEKEYKYTFETSSFWRKNRTLLLMFYLHEKGVDIAFLDRLFKIVRLWEFPKKDLEVIKDDWETIVTKIREGKAHELSEGDTFYLGACTKGVDATTSRAQHGSSIRAKQRAFSLKSRYLNLIINESLAQESEPIIKDFRELKGKRSLEDIIIDRFKPFYEMSESELVKELGIPKSGAKSRFFLIAKAILGVSKDKIEEFEKADIELKTIRLKSDEMPKESMSFPQIKFTEIINEEWEDSEWYEKLTKRFFFVIFQFDEKGELRLKRVMFWTTPFADLKEAKKVWLDTKSKIAKDDHENFIRSTQNPVAHVRPKARDSKDLAPTVFGTRKKKKSFWLNSSYLKKVVSKI